MRGPNCTCGASIVADPHHPPLSLSALHDAAEAGDVETLTAILTAATGGGGGADTEFDPARADGKADVDLDDRDADGCTPLHVALLHGE